MNSHWWEIKNNDPVKYREMLDEINRKRREKYATDPEYREKIRQIYLKKMEDPVKHQKFLDSVNKQRKKRYKEDAEFRERLYKSQLKWRRSHLEEYNAIRERSNVCRILRHHGEEMKEDPDHLQTDFMIMLINREDKQ